MANYAKPIPVDKGSNALTGSPAPFKALQTFATSAAVSSVITFNDNATQVEVGAIGGNGAVIRWIPVTETAAVGSAGSVIASGASANFDHYIPSGAVRYFVIPRETPPVTSIVGANISEGLYHRVAWVQAQGTASSVLVATF